VFIFLALVLDAITIAAQVLVGRALGQGDAGTARTVGLRTLAWALVAGCLFGVLLLALARVLPQAFTDDPAVVALALDWGITGVWAGLLALVGVRLLTLGWRFAGGRWAITGAAVARVPAAARAGRRRRRRSR